ncbi:MAG: DivIVA domain-containing protein, partial [Actinomycetota bacterium]|nr:DivIVA domain-containing protein [Actinomycetota bacterium]
MSLLDRYREASGETPEQTLARLHAASRAAAAPASGQPRGPRFTVVKMAEGYNIAEVDAFIDTIDQRTPGEVRGVQFSTSRLTRGYDEDEVDRFLDEYEARLTVAAGVTEPAHPSRAEPAPLTPAKGSEAQRGRLAHIPQRRWR